MSLTTAIRKAAGAAAFGALGDLTVSVGLQGTRSRGL